MPKNPNSLFFTGLAAAITFTGCAESGTDEPREPKPEIPCHAITKDAAGPVPFAKYPVGDVTVFYNRGDLFNDDDRELPGKITARNGQYILSVVSLPEYRDLTATSVKGAELAISHADIGIVGLSKQCEPVATVNEYNLPATELILPVTAG